MLKNLLGVLLISGVVTYLALGWYLYVNQRKYLYYPSEQDFERCAGFDGAEKVNFNGTRFYYKKNSNRLVVFYHGNGGSACDRAFLGEWFEEWGFSYLFVEYAGYGGDAKETSRDLIWQDVENINGYIKKLKVDELIVVGESLGSAPAAYHSTLSKVDKLLFVTSYSSIADVAAYYYPYFPVRWLLKDNYDSVELLENYKGKLMIIHGNRDKVIPFRFSQKLFDLVNVKDKKLVKISGAGHNDLYNYPEVVKLMKNVLEE